MKEYTIPQIGIYRFATPITTTGSAVVVNDYFNNKETPAGQLLEVDWESSKMKEIISFD